MKHTILRLTIAILALVMMLTLASCEDDGGNSLIDTSTNDTTPAETTPNSTTVHEHVYKDTVYPATCTAAGYTVHICDCGDQYVDSTTPIADHTYGEWATTTAATCTAEGIQTRVCSVCGATETQKLAAAGHKYVGTVVAPTKKTQGYTVYNCSVCGDNYVDNYTNATGSVGLAYTTNSDGTLTISGIGTCTDSEIVIYSTNADGKSVTAIAANAFAGCTTVKSIELPASITSIGSGAFAGCSALQSITVDDKNTAYSSVGGVLLNKAGTQIVAYPVGLPNTEYTVASTVTDVLPSAFAGCTKLTQFKLQDAEKSGMEVVDGVLYKKDSEGYSTLLVYPAGKDVTSFSLKTKTVTVSDYAFYGVTKLVTVDLTSATYLATIGNHAFENCTGLVAVTLPNSLTKLGEYAFSGCSNVKTLDIGNSLQQLGAHSFESCTGLATVIIPAQVTKIGDYAFYSCTGLKTLVIGSGVKSIGENAFVLCTGLASTSSNKVNIYYEGATYQEDWCKIDIHPSNNVPLTISATLVYYGEKTGCWYYVNGVPTMYTAPSTPATTPSTGA